MTSSWARRSPAAIRAPIAQKVNAPYVWLPLCLLFLAPFIDPRRPFRLLHLDLLVLLGLGVSLAVLQPRRDHRVGAAHLPGAGLRPGAHAVGGGASARSTGPADPGATGELAGDRRRRPRLRADRPQRRRLAGDRHRRRRASSAPITSATGQELYDGGFAPGVGIRGDVYGPFNYLAYVPFEAVFPWHGHWGDVPAAHAAAIAFDLLTALGLLALGRRLRPGEHGRTLGIALAFGWLAYPFTLYTMNANANDSLIAAIVVGAMLVLASPPARGAMVALGSAAKFGPAALAPLFATGTGERRWRSALVFGIAFLAVSALLVLPFLPDGGPRELYDRTLGYQASRSSPFSVWGQAPSLDFLRPLARAGAIALALAVALWPRAKDPGAGRRAGGGGADRRPARGDPLVLLLRGLVPAPGAGGPVRRAAGRGTRPHALSTSKVIAPVTPSLLPVSVSSSDSSKIESSELNVSRPAACEYGAFA